MELELELELEDVDARGFEMELGALTILRSSPLRSSPLRSSFSSPLRSQGRTGAGAGVRVEETQRSVVRCEGDGRWEDVSM